MHPDFLGRIRIIRTAINQSDTVYKGPVSVSCKQNPVWFGHWALFVDNRQFLPNELGL